MCCVVVFAGVTCAQDLDGVMGVAPVDENACIAIWIPIPAGHAISELGWYNNDNLVVFPEVLVESGNPDYPVALRDCQRVAVLVTGEASNWSEVAFRAPVASASGGVYVIFRIPHGAEIVGVGEGGGAGFGYVNDMGFTGWLSANGSDWVRLGRGCGFAVTPVFVPATDGVLIMNGLAKYRWSDKTELVAIAPNPFNPNVSIRFTLQDDTDVSIRVHDVRGAVVRDLAATRFLAGSHLVVWNGCDNGGRESPSGLYFFRMQAGGERFVRKALLVK